MGVLVAPFIGGRRSSRKSKQKKLSVFLYLINLERLTYAERCTALVAHQLNRYNIAIVALSGTLIKGDGEREEVGGGYTSFWKGKLVLALQFSLISLRSWKNSFK